MNSATEIYRTRVKFIHLYPSFIYCRDWNVFLITLFQQTFNASSWLFNRWTAAETAMMLQVKLRQLVQITNVWDYTIVHRIKLTRCSINIRCLSSSWYKWNPKVRYFRSPLDHLLAKMHFFWLSVLTPTQAYTHWSWQSSFNINSVITCWHLASNDWRLVIEVDRQMHTRSYKYKRQIDVYMWIYVTWCT